MKRNPLLRSTLLFVFCFAVVTSTVERANAQSNTTEGSLLTLNAKGEPSGACPLKHTDVKADISGFIARVTVTQQFENPFPDKIEAVYTFPLPPSAAVDDMTIVIGDRTIKGKIMRREEAQATYDAAKARGQTAALLNQQRPNIFTQAIANILPSQQINVTISYVETLKYDEGSYEWSFPMVVGERYNPAPQISDESPRNDGSPPPESTGSKTGVPDSAEIMPPVAKGIRAGHDISIAVNIDAGVPVVAVHSATHEVEALQPGANRATVRLKDQATIPNKDFVLKYDVAGAQIEDALLFHRQGKDGFFTFILQPPQRVTVADVTPKELVFVLDTSGSMGGFPIEKAKQTMMLALEGLYPQDTFNVITFAGETRILFDAPVPATPDNIAKAKRLLAHVQSEGGTEMMQAIRAALDPSDAQDHMRITCFLTDGQVGNDMEIIAEVQRHPKARVFAMGFGDAPNRFLLDKITEYGRGESQYVTQNAEAKHAAERFHERVRNPLLTDISIDWAGLPVADVYPKNIPDLFSAAPVAFSGRYLSGRDGIIRLRGKMAGSEFVREIPVHFPEQEIEHDVLATLWARSKVDDLMGQDMRGAQTGAMRDELKTEITNLGLTYRMMTQFTSFVAVDETPGDGIEPRRVDVPVESVSTDNSINASFGGVNMSVTVSSGTLQTAQSTLGTIVTQTSISELPINGRSLQGLYTVAGAVSAATSKPTAQLEPDLFVNGQRSSSNQFMIDGVSGNFGIAPGGQAPAASAGGTAPALTVTGNTSPLAPLNAIQELHVRTLATTAEYGRNSGGIVSVVTKSGTNSFHGSAFEIFGARPLNANDWFANSRGLSRPPANTNEFGGTVGGPVRRDQTFFFVAYEGLRLHQPVTALTDVPSLTARLAASSDIRQLLNLYPQPNGVTRPDGFGEFASSFANRARHDSINLRIDSNVSPRLTLGGHYNLTHSRADERGAGEVSLNTLNRLSSQSEMFTGQMYFNASPSVVADLRVNFSRMRSRSAYRIDDFAGAVIPPESVLSQSLLFAQAQSFATNLNGRSTTLLSAADATNTQRQLNVLGSVSIVWGTHTLKFGGDYRRMFPTLGARVREESLLFDGVSQALTGTVARLSTFDREPSVRPIINNFSAYAQDEWRVGSRVTLNYGLRWEVDPAPRGADAERALAVTGIDDPTQLALAPNGARLWRTTYGNFAPRAGVAYQIDNDATLLIRGSFGVLYDSANSAAGDLFVDSYPFVNGGSLPNVPFSFSSPATRDTANVTVPLSVFDPHLKLPYVLQWSASVEKELNRNNVLSIAYVGAANRRSLVTNSFFNPSSEFAFVRATDNQGRSDFRGMRIQFRRRAAKGLSAYISYSLGSATDNFSEDTAARVWFRADDARFESGRADFDIRHMFAGFASYELPAPFARGLGNALFRGWRLDSVFNIHSAQPVNVVYAIPTTFGFLYLRPDVITSAPFYLADATAAGGRRINPAAFAFPLDLRQGTLPRNALQGFPLTQIDLALRRRFKFTDDVKIVAGIEAANVFNHPNFASPAGNETVLGTRFDSTSPVHLNPTFGYSFTNAARSGWAGSGRTFGPTNYAGGPRVVRFSLKFEF